MAKNILIIKQNVIVLLINILLCPILLIAESPKVSIKNMKGDYLVLNFIENKGQLPDSILFVCPIKNGNFFFMKNGFMVSKTEAILSPKYFLNKTNLSDSKARIFENETNGLKGHNYKINFKNFLPTSKISAYKQIITQFNYILSTENKSINASCRAFQSIVYENIYPNIDIRFFVHNQQLKYDIIVRANGKIADIKFEYIGVNGFTLKNKNLHYSTSLEKIEENIPESYLLDEKTQLKETSKVKYVLEQNVVSFKTKKYDYNKTLVIDPILVFASFSGSSVDNWGFTSTYGADGSFYLGGIVFRAGFNTTAGVFQLSYGGGGKGAGQFLPPTNTGAGFFPTDAVIMKFNENGTQVIYATYLGGNNDELPNSLIEDSKGNLLILGRTGNGNTFPARNKLTLGTLGSTDIFITKLNSNGSEIIKSWVIGGANADGVNMFTSYFEQKQTGTMRFYSDMSRSEIVLDDEDNIYVASQTQSNNFPTVNAFQNTFGGGLQDAVFIKIDAEMNYVLCSSYLGGENIDAGFVLNVNKKTKDIFIAGTTLSNNFPGDKTNVLKPNIDNTDGFISHISNNNYQLLKSTFIGTTSNDYLYGIQSDKNGNIYVMGVTEGNWQVINSDYNNGFGKQFIAKLNDNLSAYLFSTRFGTNSIDPNFSPVAFAIDRCDNIYISGFGKMNIARNTPESFAIAGTAGLPVSADAIQTQTDGGDFYFIIFNRNANSILYSTFYGDVNANSIYGDHVDGGTSRFDPNGIIYQGICAACQTSARYPTTPGAIYTKKGADASECNMLGVKINFDLSGISASLKVKYLSQIKAAKVCVNIPIQFYDNREQGESYEWLFNDGTPIIKTTSSTINHVFTTIGNYNVRLVATRASTCNVSDTSYYQIKIANDKVNITFDMARDTTKCEDLKINFKNTSKTFDESNQLDSLYTWDFGDGSIEKYLYKQTVSHTYKTIGTYIVKLTAQSDFCNKTDSTTQTLNINSLTKASFTLPDTICSFMEIAVNNTSTNSDAYAWYVNKKLYSKDKNISLIFDTVGVISLTLIVQDSLTCNKIDSVVKTFIVGIKPTSSFNVVYENSYNNKIPSFINKSIQARNYHWDFGDSTYLETTIKDTILYHFYKASKLYEVCLDAINGACLDKFCQTIDVSITTTISAPNVFTPNGDNINDKFYARVNGGTFKQLKIFNRWGQVVFETNDEKNVWDGTYLGNPQANDTYTYIVEYENQDSKILNYKGSISIIR